MSSTEEKYLAFHAGSFSLLLALGNILEIAVYDSELCLPSKNSVQHHKKSTPWRQTEIPYIDMRIALGLPSHDLPPPTHTLTLSATDQIEPIVIIATDQLDKFISIDDKHWHQAKGINTPLDAFFDRIYFNRENNTLMMRLDNPAQWLHWLTTSTHPHHIPSSQ